MTSRTSQLFKLLNDNHISPERVEYLIMQGLEVEELKLQFHENSKGPALDSFITLQNGERFLALLLSSDLR
jgi:hypothetical protein